MEVRFTEFSEQFLELSWKWLKDPENRYLTNTTNFTKEQQLEWFKSLSSKKDYYIWGVKADSAPIGACGIKNIRDADCEYWGYIGEKQYWGKGLGKEMMLLVEEKARELGISSLWLKVIKDNYRAISLYLKQGYSFESNDNSLLVMRKQL